MNSNLIKGVLFIAIGSSSFGALATVAKLGTADGYRYHELLFSQCFVGLAFLFILNCLNDFNTKQKKVVVKTKDKFKLMLGGLGIALTSTFYYLSIEYTSVSICVVMLMQSVWMGSILDYFITGNKPTKGKLFAILLILIGTVLATNVLNADVKLDWRGVTFGLLSGLSYTFSLLSSNRIATNYPSLKRSLYLVLGATLIIFILYGYKLYIRFNVDVLWKWGIFLGLLGTVLPPLFFTKGMPMLGIGLGSIVASMELPVSITVAYYVLGESVIGIQWTGIFIIVLAVVLMNLSFGKRKVSK